MPQTAPPVSVYSDDVAQHRLEELLGEAERLHSLYQRLKDLPEGDERETLEADLYACALTLELRSAKFVNRVDDLVNETPAKEPQLA